MLAFSIGFLSDFGLLNSQKSLHGLERGKWCTVYWRRKCIKGDIKRSEFWQSLEIFFDKMKLDYQPVFLLLLLSMLLLPKKHLSQVQNTPRKYYDCVGKEALIKVETKHKKGFKVGNTVRLASFWLLWKKKQKCKRDDEKYHRCFAERPFSYPATLFW